MIHFYTKYLPLLKDEGNIMTREYMFVGIDDFSRELYVGILPNKTLQSAAEFLQQVMEQCPCTVGCLYSDNGTE